MLKNEVWPMIGSHQSIHKISVKERIRKSKDENGRSVVQFFNGSSYSQYRKKLSLEDTTEILNYMNMHGVQAFAHCPYVINLARDPISDDKGSKGLLALHGDISVMGPAGISSVCHIGSHLDKYSMQSVCRTLSAIDFHGPIGSYPLLLENAAGDGTDLGVTAEELTFLAQNTDPHIGFCLDTQHWFAAHGAEGGRNKGGQNFTTVDGVNEFFKMIDRSIGLDRLRLFHLNDSKFNPSDPLDRTYANKKDCHANISRGYIWGEEKDLPGLRQLLLRGGELKIPFITETPAIKDANDPGKVYDLDPEIVYSFLRDGK